MDRPYHDLDGVIWFNNKFVPWREGNIHLLTHSLHYGSCVFEGERAYNGKIFRSRCHTERLLKSAQYLGFEIPYTADMLEAAKYDTLKHQNLDNAYIRVMAWRGSEQMGISARNNKIHTAIAVWEWGAYFGDAKNKGISLNISDWVRPDPRTIPCFAKAAGLYMICTLSKHQAEMQGYADSLMLDFRGYVAEATGANILFYKDGIFYTPTPDCFLNGITRRTVISLIREKGIEVVEKHIMPSELEEFQQCFLVGTAAEVTPVKQIGSYNFEIGDVTKDIIKEYDKLTKI